MEEQPIKKKRHRRTKAEMEAARQAEAQAKSVQNVQVTPDKDAQPADLMRKELMEYSMITYCMFYCSHTSADRCRPTVKDGVSTFVLDCRTPNCPLFPYTDGASYIATAKKKLDK